MNHFPRDLSTTLQRLARQVFDGKPYISLEDPIELGFAQTDPKGFLQRFAQGALFDEAPQSDLMAGVTQSLAGRVGLARLLPLALSEYGQAVHQDDASKSSPARPSRQSWCARASVQPAL